MYCPYCSNEFTQVVETYKNKSERQITRRRYCRRCNSRFSTREKVKNETTNTELRRESGESESS